MFSKKTCVSVICDVKLLLLASRPSTAYVNILDINEVDHQRTLAWKYHTTRRYSNPAKILRRLDGTFFTERVNQVRIENAKKMLALTSKNITEIGRECGFSNTSYFIKNFPSGNGDESQ